ncbi:argininosuccinate synthase [Flavobacterium columnare]|uniref:argininosuccinate synthase n=1 Tax=Flavobacterium columnare TaxID=996 RepID=A0AAI8CK14_9FLAO|nr:argininosuccinate synthase domain-containing protein [Flavobacterium columnare]AMO21480.1 argininosuccinate synthase [Flavobacterium columnare]AUX19495.1 argininosuccinate synthase [Flavobacterium columnare]QOG57500.1 argininosuccinate synthase [Flavobacterium columnare]QOG60224.1 argininosuccinate synthase [Flavobacterium columnare]QOG62944.1 argininosuccinate synthase [Flavobacterium columnare]
MQKKKIVLAYSGGLDTTYCAVYLSKIENYEVHAVTINTGAFDQKEIAILEEKALQSGVASYICIDVRKEYYDDCIKYLIYGNVLKNGTYPLSVSAERAVQAKSIAEYAIQLGIYTIAHGSTGAGNDQVRFDMIFNHLLPNVEIITPIRDKKLSREAEIEFLKSHGVSFNFEKAVYSINKGLWGTSVGGKETLTSYQSLPEEAWPTPVSATESVDITLSFNEGELISVNGHSFEHPSIAIEYLQQMAQPFGIGRHIHVGDTIIGIKGRVGFEAAAPELIIKAHHLLEKHTLTKWQLFWKEQLSSWYGNWLHEGQMLDPTMRDIEAFLAHTQKTVSGEVYITLHPYRYELNGIESPFDLMSAKFGSYGEMNNGWSGEDVKGFTKIFGNQTSIYHQVTKELSDANN